MIEIETLAVLQGIYCHGRGRKDMFTTDKNNSNGELVAAIVDDEAGHIWMMRGGNTVVLPYAAVTHYVPVRKEAVGFWSTLKESYPNLADALKTYENTATVQEVLSVKEKGLSEAAAAITAYDLPRRRGRPKKR